MEKELEEWRRLHQFHLYSGTYETKDLANCLNVSPRTIQRWLKGKSNPKEKHLAQIRRYLAQQEPKNTL